MRAITLLLLASSVALPARAQSTQRPTLKTPELKNAEEVQKPAPFSDPELKVLQNVQQIPADRLVQLLKAYEKLDNKAMMQIIVRQLLTRNPSQPDALRAKDILNSKDQVRPADYTRKLVADVLAGKKVEDADAIAGEAQKLLEQDRAKEAVTLLEKLRGNQFAQGYFPYLDDLAAAQHGAGDLDKAASLFLTVSKDPQMSAETRSEAERELKAIELERRIGNLRQQASSSPDRGLAAADKFLTEHPSSPEAIAFKLEALDRAGRYADAVKMLETMKGKSAAKPFEYQETLAYAYLGAKQYNRARTAFQEVIDDKSFDEATRKDAAVALRRMGLQDKIERGQAALERGDAATAKALLRDLDHDFPGDDEVVGYRAIVLAKTGHAKEALELLLRYREKAAREHRLFTQMGALADVYAERKEYNLAKSAYDDIIANPAYDEEQRSEARTGLDRVKKEALLDRASAALDQGDVSTASSLAAKAGEIDPNDADLRILLADIKVTSGSAREALKEYEALKAREWKGRPFPGQDGIAEAHYRLGEWDKALAANEEIIRTPGYESKQVWDAIWDKRSLLQLTRPHLKLDLNFLNELEGTALSEQATFASKWYGDWRAIVTLREDTIRLDDSQRITARSSSSRLEGSLAMQRRFDGGYFAEATVGGADSNVIYGARVGKFANQGLGWSLGFSGNALANDSLPLMVLNGRENRIDLKLDGHIHPRVLVNLDAFARWVSVGGQRLGDGYGFEGSIDYIFAQETRNSPEVLIGWFGEYSRFSSGRTLPSSVRSQLRGQDLQVRKALAASQELKAALPANYGNEVFDTLVDPRVNRQGVQLTLRKKVSLNLDVFLQGGIYRDFTDRSWEFAFAAGLQYWVSDSTLLYAELRYDTNGLGANGGHGVWEATVGGEMTF